MLTSTVVLALMALSTAIGIVTLAQMRQLTADYQLSLQATCRQRIRMAERLRLRKQREHYELVAKTAQNLAGAMMDEGSKAARDVHREIANVPFDILESIPATRDTTKVVRGLHDTIADASYGSVGLIGKLIKARKNAKPNTRPPEVQPEVRPDSRPEKKPDRQSPKPSPKQLDRDPCSND